jgi:glycosyltransferase involved in cell wall biosynthesis
LTANTDKANPLRIGLMLRAIDDVDGQGIYIRKLCDALFDLDTRNEYVAFYSDECQAGRYADRDNVREIVVRGRGKLLWDQVSPLAARRERVDVLFHHKFSTPLIASSPTVVQQRGTEYWSHPEFYVGWAGRLDRIYNRIMIPLYCRRAARVLTNSNTLGEELIRYIDVPRSKLRTVYASADESFRPVTDTGILSRVRAQYSLPAYPFLLMVVKGHQVMGQASGKALTPRKNVEVALEAYGRMRRYAAERALPAVPDLVILGLGIAERITEEMILEHADPSTVHTPGFVAFDDMPAVYTMARAPIFPSRYESFGIPIVEAMACGCPVVTAATSACPEIAGDAALLVDPDDVAGLASAMQRISFDEGLAEELRQKGFRRAASFSWEHSARTLLEELRRAARCDR